MVKTYGDVPLCHRMLLVYPYLNQLLIPYTYDHASNRLHIINYYARLMNHNNFIVNRRIPIPTESGLDLHNLATLHLIDVSGNRHI